LVHGPDPVPSLPSTVVTGPAKKQVPCPGAKRLEKHFCAAVTVLPNRVWRRSSPIAPETDLRGRRTFSRSATLLVSGAGTVISLLCAGLCWQSERADREQRFVRQVETRLRVFDERMGRCGARLFALRMLFETTPWCRATNTATWSRS
jgi:hypothetical protein